MTTTPEYEIVVVGPGSENRDQIFDQCLAIRFEVFCDEQGFSREVEPDEYDVSSAHFLLRLLPDMEPAGTIRCVSKPSKDGYQIYKLTRLAVKAKYRRHKFGKKLVDVLNNWALADGQGKPIRILANSQIYAIPFYEKSGYIPEGEEFDQHGAPHKLLTLTLAP